jgi:hypothetical protein
MTAPNAAIVPTCRGRSGPHIRLRTRIEGEANETGRRTALRNGQVGLRLRSARYGRKRGMGPIEPNKGGSVACLRSGIG